MDLSSANDHFTQAPLCLLITIFLERLERICPEGDAGTSEWAKHYFITCDNISSAAEIYGRRVSTQRDGIKSGWQALGGGGGDVAAGGRVTRFFS